MAAFSSVDIQCVLGGAGRALATLFLKCFVALMLLRLWLVFKILVFIVVLRNGKEFEGPKSDTCDEIRSEYNKDIMKLPTTPQIVYSRTNTLKHAGYS